MPWLLAAARRAVALGAFADALGHLEPLLDHRAGARRGAAAAGRGARRARRQPGARRVRDRRAGRRRAGSPHDLRAKQALAEIKQGDPPGALRTLDGLRPVSVPGRLAQALALQRRGRHGVRRSRRSGTAKAAECRRLALESGDRTALVIASWAQAAAAHARDDLRDSVWADLLDTHALRELAVSVFDGHLCITQRLLYGARPYPDVIAFADSFRAEARAARRRPRAARSP